MQRIDQILSEYDTRPPVFYLPDCQTDRLLILDIETTGLSARSSSLYLIGCVYYSREDGHWHVLQWFLDSPADEIPALKEFMVFARKYSCYMTFNGATFDIPYLRNCARQYHLIGGEAVFDGMLTRHVDLMQMLRPIKSELAMENGKLKTYEQAIGIDREDIYSGLDLIAQYEEYRDAYLNHSQDTDRMQALKDNLLLHNREDIANMPRICELLNLYHLFENPEAVTNLTLECVNSPTGNHYRIQGQLLHPLPCAFDLLQTEAVTCQTDGRTIQLDIRQYDGILKYFYEPYKDYFYLPEEDVAVHKKVAAFVDSAHKEKATAQNCYIKQEGSFLPEGPDWISPSFRSEYRKGDNLRFFELTEDIRKQLDQQTFLQQWVHSLLSLGRPKGMKDLTEFFHR